MFRLHFLRIFPGLLVALLLVRDSAYAKFTLEFTDGRKITVSNYKEVGQTVTVYTSNGSFAFRKSDIARIIDIESPQPKPTRPMQAPAYTPPPAPQPTEERPTVSSPLIPRTTTHDPLPLPDWDVMFGFVAEGVYRARFFIALFAGLKVLQFFLPASIR